jgi:hypothetical protein
MFVVRILQKTHLRTLIIMLKFLYGKEAIININIV